MRIKLLQFSIKIFVFSCLLFWSLGANSWADTAEETDLKILEPFLSEKYPDLDSKKSQEKN